MDKIELKNKISKLEGLTRDEKSALINMLNHEKKYGLVWEDKPEEVEERLRDELPVLREVKERAIVSKADDAPNHILIEGDNLEALTALSYTHAGKIDVIYIDPPYNTGKKDFIYNDSFVDSEDSFRHSKWLSFMDRRLKLAKRLLSNKGVIFISIDDNEQAQLKLLCDEIFRGYNKLGEIVWETATDNNPTQISIVHEYILCYANNKDNLGNWAVTSDKAFIIKDKYNEFIASGEMDLKSIRKKLKTWINSVKKSNELDLSGVSHYDYVDEKGVFYPGNSANTKPGGYSFDIIHPLTGRVCKKPSNGYRWTESTFWAADKRGDVLWGEDENTIPKIKKRIETATELLKSCYYEDGRAATAALTDIMGSKKFNNPKPMRLMTKILNFSTFKNSTILDFFAGSGTTLHATMQLNKEDGGHRKCILVTNNENGICENVTYERNERVINGYITPKGEEVEGLHDNTLRYYKTDFISRDQSPKNMRALVAASTDLLCIKNDIYTEADFAGRKLNRNFVRYFEDKHQRMLVIYDDRAIGAIAELLQTVDLDNRGKIKVYTFSSSRYAYDDEFMEVADKVTLCALPAAIYDAYKQVLPKRKPKYLPEALVEGEATETKNEARQGELNFGPEGGEA